MSNDLEQSIENAQKITLGQVDNGTLATAVTCAESLAIVRHGRVESYVMPKHLIDDLLMKVAVLECDNKRLLGERVATSIGTHRVQSGFSMSLEELKRTL